MDSASNNLIDIDGSKSENKKSTQKRNNSRKNTTNEESFPNSTQDIVSLEASEPSDSKVTQKETPTKIIEENNSKNDRNVSSKQEKKCSF